MTRTPELCSVHTHSCLCDGKGTLAEMAEAAYQAGVRYFGASGHSHTEIPHDAGNVLPADPADVLALTDYGVPVTAAVGRGNVYGCQFHPEKSGEVGLQILRNFGELSK